MRTDRTITEHDFSLAALLERHAGTPAPVSQRELREQALLAVLPLLLVLALVGVWAAHAPLAGAVVAPAQVKVESNRKTVQHQEGGIVREILVRDGQRVRAGDPLVVIGNVAADASLSLLKDQWRAERVRGARAAAEAALQPRFALPDDLRDDTDAAVHAARQRALFDARKRTLDEQVASLQSQIRDAHAQAAALQTQIAATETSQRLAAEELQINETLAQQGYIQRTRLLALKRDTSDYGARVGEQRSDLAVARQRAGELQARIAQARNQYQQLAADELKESTQALREIEERLKPSRDEVERQVVRSPVDGEVMALRVSALGQGVGAREPVADIVPERERLVVEARIRPEDIDHVRRGARADVRVAAFDADRAPLHGTVTFVSPDRVSASDGSASWYVATVEVDAAALSGPELRLQAGMPAEVFVATAERSLFEYLARPLTAFNERALREP